MMGTEDHCPAVPRILPWSRRLGAETSRVSIIEDNPRRSYPDLGAPSGPTTTGFKRKGRAQWRPQVLNASLQIDTGVRVGHYLLERRLGKTRTGAAYLARHSGGQRAVVRLFEAGTVTGSALSRMKREARALASVCHRGVERIYGIGDHEGVLWIASELVGGTSLDHVLAERGPLCQKDALRHAIEAADALAAAHDAGVVHRQVEPSKILVTPDGRSVLVGFGIGPCDRASVAPNPGEKPASPSAYAAPEQIEHGLADERSDMWALGCVLYEMVVGVPPFGRGGSAAAASVLRDEPVFPTHLPPGIVHIVNACVRKNSFARIATPRELLVLLRDALELGSSEPAPYSDREPCTGDAGLSSAATIPPPPRLPSMAFRTPSGRFSADAPSPPPSSATRMASARGRVKGAAIRAGVAWFAEAYGGAALARVADLASPELRAILRPQLPVFGLIASGWYDTQIVGELIELVERVASPGDPVAFRSSIGEAIAHENVGGIHRTLFRMVASPSLLEANAQRVWRTYVDEGSFTVHHRAEGKFDARVRGWSRHHPSVCRTMRAVLESSLAAVGYTDLVLERTQCVGLGDTQCTFGGTWTV